jgi:formylglycine-generating enzyme required for sulfatase activity
MPSKLPLLIIFLGLIKMATAQTPLRQGRDHAVLFYVTEYQKPWQNLPNTRPEMEGIGNDLRSIYGFTTDLQANKNSTQITDKLVELKNRSYGPNDQLLLFFSMHGHYSVDAYSGCLVPAGGLGDDPAYRTWILHNNLKALVTQIPCEHILLVIDACYSGSFAGVKSQPDPPPGPTCADKIKNALQRNGRQYLCAGGNQKVPAVSTFVQKWRSALGSQGGEDGILNYRELVIQVSDAEPNPTWGDFDGHLGGNFLFISKQACGGSPPPPPTDPDQAACISARRQKSIAAWDFYLKNFPNGTCRYEAQEEMAWLRALQSGEPAAFQMFMDMFPGSRRVEEAKKRIGPATTDDDEYNMVLVRGGSYNMGCTSEQQDCGDDEKPAHRVSVSDFYIGKYEVTVAEFKRFVDEKDHRTDAENDGGSYIWDGKEWVKKAGINWRHDVAGQLRSSSEMKHPVIHVSWNDAQAYCQWLSQKTGKSYRLPSEAEWEYAAREGGKAVLFGNGKNIIDPAQVNFGSVEAGKKPYSVVGTYRQKTVPVGSLNSPNALGLHDMSGNVWEWCSDWYGSDYYQNSPNSNPKGPDSGSDRVIRGGSWVSFPRHCRVAVRNYSAPGNRYSYLGFRLARTP